MTAIIRERMTVARPRRNVAASVPAWAQRLKQARERAGLSQSRLAQAIGKSQSAYSQWELGDHQPNLAEFETLAEITGVDYVWLLTGRDPPDRDALRRLIAEAQEENRHFGTALLESCRMFREEGMKADILYIFDFAQQILTATKGSDDEASAEKAITRKLEAERAEFRKGLNELRKKRLQPGKSIIKD